MKKFYLGSPYQDLGPTFSSFSLQQRTKQTYQNSLINSKTQELLIVEFSKWGFKKEIPTVKNSK